MYQSDCTSVITVFRIIVAAFYTALTICQAVIIAFMQLLHFIHKTILYFYHPHFTDGEVSRGSMKLAD